MSTNFDQNKKLNNKIVHFRLWQREKLKKAIADKRLTDSITITEALGYYGEASLSHIRFLQSEVGR